MHTAVTALRDLPLGFADAVNDAQAAFRAALQALSRPGQVVDGPQALPPVPGLMPATVALLLALTDHETPVWWCDLRGAPGRHRDWLRFHTGAPCSSAIGQAAFVVVPWGGTVPDLPSLAAGTDAAPERSATLLVEVPAWTGGPTRRWAGPGLREPRSVSLPGLPSAFWEAWDDNHTRFPSGVDVFFVRGGELMGLPRTTAVSTEASR